MRMRQETFKKSYYIPAFGKSIEIRRNQDIDEEGVLGKELLAQYGEDCILEGETKSLMEKIVSGDISGTSLTTEQTEALGKIDGLEVSASEINNGIINYDETGTHVFILAGQSNMVGWDVFSNTKGDYPTGVMQVARTGKTSGGLDNELVQAISPLDNWGANAGTMGLSLEFAHKYKEQFPNVELVFIPCAQGGTGFISNNWNKGDILYEDMILRANLLFSNNPTYKLKGVLWHQGEQDFQNVTYEDDLILFFNNIRADINYMTNDTPIFSGGLLPFFANIGVDNLRTYNTIKNLSLKNYFFIDSFYPIYLDRRTSDGYHFSSSSLNLLGTLYFSTYLAFINKGYFENKSLNGIFASRHNPIFTGSSYNLGNGSVATNLCFGNGALGSNTNGYSNTALGNNSQAKIKGGSANVSIGDYSLSSSETASSITAIGSRSAVNFLTGNGNSFYGANSASSLTSGSSNCFFGSGAGSDMTTSSFSTIFGCNSGKKSSSEENTLFGYRVSPNNLTGANNAFGVFSLYSNVSGHNNTAFGSSTLYRLTTGEHNIAIGSNSGYNITTGKSNITIGGQNQYSSFVPAYNITTENNYISMGSTAVTNAYIQVAWTVVSDERDKTDFDDVPHGLDFVSKLKPIKYKFRESRDSDVAIGDVKYGFKAQDILALEGDDSVIVDNKDSEKLRYTESNLIPILVKAIQELKAEIEILKSKV